MTSGLDSIAMAVAHLERTKMGAAAAPPEPATEAPATGPAAAPLASIPPQSFRSMPRVVSTDVSQGSSPATLPYTLAQQQQRAVEQQSSVQPPLSKPNRESPSPLQDADDDAAAAAAADDDNAAATLGHEQAKSPKTKLVRGHKVMESRQIRLSAATKHIKNLDHVFEPSDLNSPNAPPAPDAKEVFDSVQEDDVLCGRGGETNHHTGNIQYRMLVKACQHAYLAAKRRDKPRIAAGIVLAVRKVGGRFLKKDGKNTWKDVGNSRAREKTSQALREGAPELRSSVANPAAAPPPKSAPIMAPRSMPMPIPANAVPPMAPITQHPRGVTLVPSRPGPVVLLPKSSVSPVPRVIDAALVMSNLMTDQGPAKKAKHQSSLDSLADAAALRPVPMYHHQRHGFTSAPAWPVPPQVQQQHQQPPHPLAVGSHLRSAPPPRHVAPQAVPLPPAAVAAADSRPKSPAKFPATVSGDDDDDTNSASSSSDHSQKEKRGPRIKLLKRRLESSN